MQSTIVHRLLIGFASLSSCAAEPAQPSTGGPDPAVETAVETATLTIQRRSAPGNSSCSVRLVQGDEAVSASGSSRTCRWGTSSTG